MKTYFKLELKKALFSWRTIIPILIILVILGVPVYKHWCKGVDGIDYYIRICRFSFIGLAAPMVVGLIYSTAIVKDMESGFINKLLEIINIKVYISVKLAVNAVVTFIVFVVGHGLTMLYLVIIFGASNEPLKEDIGSGAFSNTFLSIYGASKISFLILILLMTAISAAAFSVFILAVTTVTKTKLFAYILPIAYSIVTGVFFEMTVLNNPIDFNIAKLFNIVGYSTSGLHLFVYDLILVIVGVGMMYLLFYKKSLSGDK